jgi:hypothetical protein
MLIILKLLNTIKKDNMKHGLKGVTDATVFCKSMKKGGPAPMIRSMKSYEVGGVTGLQSPNAASAESQCTGGPGDPPGCRGSKRKVRQKKYIKRRRVPGL